MSLVNSLWYSSFVTACSKDPHLVGELYHGNKNKKFMEYWMGKFHVIIGQENPQSE